MTKNIIETTYFRLIHGDFNLVTKDPDEIISYVYKSFSTNIININIQEFRAVEIFSIHNTGFVNYMLQDTGIPVVYESTLIKDLGDTYSLPKESFIGKLIDPVDWQDSTSEVLRDFYKSYHDCLNKYKVFRTFCLPVLQNIAKSFNIHIFQPENTTILYTKDYIEQDIIDDIIDEPSDNLIKGTQEILNKLKSFGILYARSNGIFYALDLFSWNTSTLA